MNSHLKPTRGRSRFSRLVALTCALAASAGFALTTRAQDNSANFDKVSAALIAESCLPANGAIDPGETNTVRFVIKKIGDGTIENVAVRLKAVPGAVTFVSGVRKIGSLTKDQQASVEFTYVNEVACLGQVDLTLEITSTVDGDGNPTFANPSNQGSLVFNSELPEGGKVGARVQTPNVYANASSITIRDSLDTPAPGGPPTTASTYPSTITVAGVPLPSASRTFGYKVNATIKGLSHGFSPDVDILLVSPNNRGVKLMSDSGFSPVNGANLTFSDDASASLPIEADIAAIVSGTYKPSNYGQGEDSGFPAGVEIFNTLADAFKDLANPNGEWKLYVLDDNTGANGLITGGWEINIVSTERVCCLSGYPTIAANDLGNPIPNLTGDSSINEDTVDRVITFYVDSVEFEANQLATSAFSSDQNIIANDKIKVEPTTGNTRTVKFSTVKDAFGLVTLNIRADAPSGKSTTVAVQVNINPINDGPSITPPANKAQNVGVATAPLPFTIGDAESSANDLIVTATAVAGATSLVPNSNIFLGGSGSERTIQILPNSSTPGEVTIQIVVTDPQGRRNIDENADSGKFKVAFTVVTGFPTIDPINDTSVEEDKTMTVPVVINDSATAANSLTTTTSYTSNPPDLVNSLSITGTGSNRTLTIVPKPNLVGSANVRVNVRDADGNESSTTFIATFTQVNDAPTISTVGTLTINEDTTSSAIGFTVGDVETPAGDLVVTRTSSNTILLPETDVNLALGGSGAERTITVKPTENQFGTAIVSLRVRDAVNDETGTATTSFQVIVLPVNDAPNFTGLNPNSDGSGTAIGDTEATALQIDEDAAERSIYVVGITPGPNEVGQIMQVTVTSDKPDILPNPTVFEYNGTAATATLKIKPAENKNGLVTLTVSLVDNGGTANGGNNTVTKTFKVNIKPVNDLPTLSDVPTQNAGLGQTLTIPITVADIDNDVTTLVLSADPNPLVSTIIVSGAGPSRFLTLVMNETTGGTTTITYRVKDPGTEGVLKTFTLNLSSQPPNKRPTITLPASLGTPPAVNQDEDTIVTISPITVDDPDGNASALTLSGTSDNPDVVLNVNIVPSGTGNIRNVIIVPNKDAVGVANITITVTDAGDAQGFNKLASSATFKLTLQGVPDQPTAVLTGSTTVNVREDTATKDADNGSDTTSNLIEFTASDAINETTPANLQIKITSDNKDLIPEANVVVSGPLGTGGSLRTLTITPGADRNGTTTVTVRVTDETGLSSAFTLTVNVSAVNDAPTVDQPANQNLAEVSAITQRSITLTGVSVGGGDDEKTQTLSWSFENDKTDIVSGLTVGAVDSEKRATLTFNQQPNKFGTATIKLIATDSGSAADPNKNRTERTFTITIGQVNGSPTISAIPDQTINQGSSTSVLPFTVGDDAGETPPQNLIVNATSSNSTLVPPSSLILGGSGANRSIVVVPVASQFGTATITVTVTDSGNAAGQDVKSSSRTFLLTVNLVKQPPVVSTIPDVEIIMNEESDIIPFTVNDQETPANQLIVSAVNSTDPVLIPVGNVQFGGSGSNRLMIIIPANDRNGLSTVTIRVTDADNMTTDRSFKVTVRRPNTPPTISSIANQTINENSTTGPIAFRVADLETASGFLTVSGTSSNPALVPVSNIVFGGSRNDRTVTVTPLPNQSGSTTITVTVADADGGTASTTFAVTVRSGNTAPTISAIADQTTTQDTPTGIIPFTVSDAETALGFLVVSGSSSDTMLVPNGNIFFGGSAGRRTVFIAPALGKTGSSTITVTVTDPGGLSASTQFKLTVTAAAGSEIDDLNGDGKSDIVFQDADGFLAAWFMNGSELVEASLLSPNNAGEGWRAVANGDFNKDGKADLLFQHTDGSLAVWYMDGVTLNSAVLLNPSNAGADWHARAVGDFNGDGSSDVLFQSDSGELAVWYMNGVNLNSPAILNPSSPGAGWMVVASADINSDGNEDVVFQNTDGTLAVWYMNGIDLNSATLINPENPGSGWKAVGSTDLNGDGQADLLFQNDDGSLAVWYLNGVDLVQAKLLNPASAGGSWSIAAP